MPSRALAAVAAVVLVPVGASTAVAAVSSGTYKAGKGQVQRGYDLKFTVDKRGTRITKLVAHVLETCDGSTTSSVTTVGPKLSWAIKGGRFSGRKKEVLDGVTVYTTLKGSISGSTAKGTLRQETIVAGSVCDTYALRFTARRR